MEKIFRRNVLFTDVDGLRGVNTYTIKAEYDVRHEGQFGAYYKLGYELIDEFTMTWDEIERDGGIAQVKKDLKECYGV